MRNNDFRAWIIKGFSFSLSHLERTEILLFREKHKHRNKSKSEKSFRLLLPSWAITKENAIQVDSINESKTKRNSKYHLLHFTNYYPVGTTNQLSNPPTDLFHVTVLNFLIYWRYLAFLHTLSICSQSRLNLDSSTIFTIFLNLMEQGFH